jgi:hypothetical protein
MKLMHGLPGLGKPFSGLKTGFQNWRKYNEIDNGLPEQGKPLLVLVNSICTNVIIAIKNQLANYLPEMAIGLKIIFFISFLHHK